MFCSHSMPSFAITSVAHYFRIPDRAIINVVLVFHLVFPGLSPLWIVDGGCELCVHVSWA
jgi:hypothetical protein